MFCRKCGKEIPDDSNVCQYCGVAVVRNQDKNASKEVVASGVAVAEKPKKPVWKIIVPIVAVLLIVAIVCGVFACVNNKKKEAEEKLRQLLEESTTKPVVEFMCEDYDGNGTYEAYAVVGESEEKEEYIEYYDADICFVNEAEAEVIKSSVRGHSNGTIEVGDTIYVSLEVYDDGAETGKSYIYTAEENKSVESDISGQYSNVHEEYGKVVATDEIGNKIEIEIPDKTSEEDKWKDEKRLEATEEDFDNLVKYTDVFVNGFNFEKTRIDDVLDRFMDFEYGNANFYQFLYCSNDHQKMKSENLIEGDPKGYFEDLRIPYPEIDNEYGYVFKLPAEKVDRIIKEIFHMEPDHNYQSYRSYYYDGFYYCQLVFAALGGIDEVDLDVVDYKRLDDGRYRIKVNYKFYWNGELSQDKDIIFTAALIDFDGQRVWSFYKCADVTSIPEDAFKYDGHYYKLYSSKDFADIWNAEEHCRKLGGHIVNISSTEENNTVYQYAKTNGCTDAYIGYIFGEYYGEWYWSGYQDEGFENWSSNQPIMDYNMPSKIARFNKDTADGKWKCDQWRNGSFFICEWDEEVVW